MPARTTSCIRRAARRRCRCRRRSGPDDLAGLVFIYPAGLHLHDWPAVVARRAPRLARRLSVTRRDLAADLRVDRGAEPRRGSTDRPASGDRQRHRHGPGRGRTSRNPAERTATIAVGSAIGHRDARPATSTPTATASTRLGELLRARRLRRRPTAGPAGDPGRRRRVEPRRAGGRHASRAARSAATWRKASATPSSTPSSRSSIRRRQLAERRASASSREGGGERTWPLPVPSRGRRTVIARAAQSR